MGADGAQAVGHQSWGNFNFSRSVTGIKKWFWVTIEGYLSYILPKFEDFIPTGLGSGALKSMHGFSEYTQYLCSGHNKRGNHTEAGSLSIILRGNFDKLS